MSARFTERNELSKNKKINFQKTNLNQGVLELKGKFKKIGIVICMMKIN